MKPIYWIFLRHFDKVSEQPMIRLPFIFVSRFKSFLWLQILVNRWSDRCMGLSQEGVLAAAHFGQNFVKFLDVGAMWPERIYISPFKRVRQSLYHISACLSCVPVVIDQRLREIDQGIRFGQDFKRICSAFPLYVQEIKSKGYLYCAPPGADCHATRRDRDICPFLEELKRRSENVLVITHAGVIECVHNIVAGTTDDEVVKKFSLGRSARPGSLLVIEFNRLTGDLKILFEDHLL